MSAESRSNATAPNTPEPSLKPATDMAWGEQACSLLLMAAAVVAMLPMVWLPGLLNAQHNGLVAGVTYGLKKNCWCNLLHQVIPASLQKVMAARVDGLFEAARVHARKDDAINKDSNASFVFKATWVLAAIACTLAATGACIMIARRGSLRISAIMAKFLAYTLAFILVAWGYTWVLAEVHLSSDIDVVRRAFASAVADWYKAQAW